MKGYSQFLDVLEKISKGLVAVMFSAMTLIMIYQVVLRYCFHASNVWSEEISRYLFVYIVLIASFLAIRNYSHLQVDVLINSLSPRAKCRATILCTAVGLVFLIALTYAGVTHCMYTYHSISPALKTSMIYFYASIPIGGMLMILASIEVIGKQIAEWKQLKEVA